MIRAALAKLGIPRDALIMVHSSFSGLAAEGLAPMSTAETLADYFSPGTLLMPAMSWRYVTPEKPNWHELNTPSNVGILSETFRTHVATHRSIHPTHSVAGVGSKATWALGTHHYDETPCSKQSPFGKLCDEHGWVLLIGTGIDCCTVVHHAEEVVAPDIYLRSEIGTYACEDRTGDLHIVQLRRHKLLARNYWQFQDALAMAGLLRVVSIGAVVCRAFLAADLLRACIASLGINNECIIARYGERYRRM